MILVMLVLLQVSASPDPEYYTTTIMVAKMLLQQDVRTTYKPQLFPRVPMPHWDDELYAARMDPKAAPPYMATVDNVAQLVVSVLLGGYVRV